ncbi:hypothetical protein [Hyphobacterium sp.]|jgi:hypothetical protein|uniref:hypothetical protein n=1 Tax=Hyphobacterium sp. TaxID=2004662 RepID=UPI003BABB0DC
MTTTPRRTLRELGHMLAQQARLLKAEGKDEARKLADRAGDYFNLARSYPLYAPVPVRIRTRR